MTAVALRRGDSANAPEFLAPDPAEPVSGLVLEYPGVRDHADANANAKDIRVNMANARAAIAVREPGAVTVAIIRACIGTTASAWREPAGA